MVRVQCLVERKGRSAHPERKEHLVAHGVVTLSVAPDGSVTVRSSVASAGAVALLPGGDAAQPDSAARRRSIATVLAIIERSSAS